MIYKGPLEYKRMTKWARRAYYSWSQQQTRSRKRWGIEVGYTSREFIGWWLQEMKQKRNWKCPTISRINHDLGYFFANVMLEEKADNIRERNTRCGNPGNKHRSVHAFCLFTGELVGTFVSKRAAAAHFHLSEKTVYNRCQGRTTQFFKFGPKTANRPVRFEWT